MLTKQRLGEAADMLNMKFNFDKNVEFLGHKEEAARELYNELRNVEAGRPSMLLLNIPTPPPPGTMAEVIDIVFDGPPGPVAGRFVEVENSMRESISRGEWVERPDGYWALRMEVVFVAPKSSTSSAEPAQPTASQYLEASQSAAGSPG